LLGQSIYGPLISALARLWSPYVEAGHGGEAEQKFYNCFHKFKRTVQ